MRLENPNSTQEGALEALRQLQQSGRTVEDILTWIRCFSLCVAMMAKQWPELVVPMILHMHTITSLQSFQAGMTWLHYDWKARQEMNADGSLSWQRRDPRQLVSCLPGFRTLDDPYAPIQNPVGSMRTSQGNGGYGTSAAVRQGSNRGRQLTAGGRQRCLNTARGLFNRASAGCHYGKECIYAHQYTQCRSKEHGRHNCLALVAEGDRNGENRRNLCTACTMYICIIAMWCMI